MALPIVQKIVDFLRAGYPEGVPKVDYIPLFALLSRRLTSEEVTQVVDELVYLGQIDGTLDIRTVSEAVTAITHQPALQNDVQRVADRMAAVGWVSDTTTSGD